MQPKFRRRVGRIFHNDASDADSREIDIGDEITVSVRDGSVASMRDSSMELSLFAPTRDANSPHRAESLRSYMYDVFKYRFLSLHVSRAAVAFYAHATQIEHCSRIHIQLHCDDSIYSLSEIISKRTFC